MFKYIKLLAIICTINYLYATSTEETEKSTCVPKATGKHSVNPFFSYGTMESAKQGSVPELKKEVKEDTQQIVPPNTPEKIHLEYGNPILMEISRKIGSVIETLESTNTMGAHTPVPVHHEYAQDPVTPVTPCEYEQKTRKWDVRAVILAQLKKGYEPNNRYEIEYLGEVFYHPSSDQWAFNTEHLIPIQGSVAIGYRPFAPSLDKSGVPLKVIERIKVYLPAYMFVFNEDAEFQGSRHFMCKNKTYKIHPRWDSDKTLCDGHEDVVIGEPSLDGGKIFKAVLH